MEKNLKVRFKQRTDTAANWAAKNPVLLQGEIGCESDTDNLKIGDGTKAWNDLAYVKEKLAKVATSGSYNDLSNKPTIPSVPGSIKNPYALTFTGAVTGSYDGSAAKSVAIPIVDSALSASSANAIQNKAVNTALAGKANKATTLAGYGITDAKIASGVITIGGNTITPLTSHQSLAAYAKTADVNTALAKKVDKASVLTNQNLNDIKTDGDYYAGGANTVTNKPSGIDAFGLTVYHTANEYITQDLVEGNTNPQKRYTRQFNAQNWSAWVALPAFTANPASGQVLVADGTLGGIKTSGYTIASSVPANAKFTDTNTWRGIQNNLTSDSTSDSLAAAQGKALKTLVDGKAVKATTLAGYGITDAKISGGVITLGSSTITPLTSHQSLANYYTKGNVDTLISNLKAGLVNVVDSLPTAGENGKLYLVKTGTEDKNVYTEYVYVNSAWEKLGTQKLDLSGYLTKTDASSTYLGKTAAAASANKLNTNAGSGTQPVYFANGVPVATTYTLGKSVPSNAVFTDTNNKVTQTSVTDSDYTNYRPLVWGASNSGTKGFTPDTVTDGVFTSKGLYVQPSSGLIHATTFEGNLTGTASNAAKVNNLTVLTAVPANAKFTDTVYTHPSTHPASMITGLATVATSGSYADLTDKPTIPAAYSLPDATASVKGGVKIGSNLTVSSGTLSLTKANVTSALGYTPPTTNTTYNDMTAATASAAGTHGLVPAPAAGKQLSFLRGDGTWAVPTDTTYPMASSKVNGIMAATDKAKLDGIAVNANNYSHPSYHPASMITGLATVATSGSYNDLSNKPTSLPANGGNSATVNNLTVETAVPKNAKFTDTVYTHPSSHPASMITGLAKIATSGSYNDLTNKPTIPTIPSSLPANGGTATNANNVAITNSNPTTATTYYPTFAANVTGTLPIRGNNGYRYYTIEGTTAAVGQAQLGLGNETASGTAGNKTGVLYMYGTGTGYTNLNTANTSSSNYTATLPAKNGTIAMTSDIPTKLPANGGNSTTVNGHTVNSNVPANAKFTDTVYTLPDATTSTKGGVKVGSNITVSSGTISLTKANVTNALGYTPPTTNTTYNTMGAATASTAGKAGLVPAPAAGKQTSFLRGDGTWVIPTNTTYSNMKGATSSAAGSAGLVPAPAPGAQGLYLRGDGTWATPTNTTYGAATSSTLGLVKVGSNITVSSGTISLTKSDVTAALGYTPPTTNTTYSNMTAATASAAGKSGLVPAPAAGAQTKFLRGDGTWQNVDTSSAKVKMVVY